MLGGKAVWKKQIRADALSEANSGCSLCGSGDGRLSCHEKWDYNDKTGTAALVGFQINCGNCDTVTHIGRAGQVLPLEELIPLAVDHLCRVNKCTQDEAVQIIHGAFEKWEKRNKKKWKLKVSPSLVERYPDLAALPDFVPPPPPGDS
ncbi:MAG: hypothetical protein WB341_15785 [Terracidiphilus sp.]